MFEPHKNLHKRLHLSRIRRGNDIFAVRADDDAPVPRLARSAQDSYELRYEDGSGVIWHDETKEILDSTEGSGSD